MIAILRVRFTSNPSTTTYWPDQLVHNWMQPLREGAIANFWWLSSHALFDLGYVLYPPVTVDGSAPTNEGRGPLQDKVIAAATTDVHPAWADVDIVVMLFEQTTGWWGGGEASIPLPDGTFKTVPVTVIDQMTPFDAACQELGHSFGLKHELRVDGAADATKATDTYSSPYSVMSA
jgi:hypothetical protein